MTEAHQCTVQTLPATPKPDIPRDGFIRELQNTFSPECQMQIVVGARQTGKTNLLAQFARDRPERCVSYFITDRPLSQRQHSFLFAMCCQLSSVLDTTTPPDTIGLEDLKNLFTSLCIHLTRSVREAEDAFYFVIDGLEHALEAPKGDRIIDLFPLETAPYSPYLLISCRDSELGKLPEPLKYHPFEIKGFTRVEVETYLSDTGFSEDDINTIQRRYEGIPGYLRILKEEKRRNPHLDLDAVPEELTQLVIHQVESICSRLSSPQMQVFHILATAPAPLPVAVLSELAGMSKDNLEEMAESNPLIDIDLPAAKLTCPSELTRESLCQLYPDQTDTARKKLTDWLKEHHPEERMLISLLLESSKDYAGFTELLAKPAVITTVESVGDVSLVLNQFRQAALMAKERSITRDLIRWSLGIASVRALISHAVRSDEIRALLSVGRTTKALSMAYAIPDRSIKVRLLAKAYASMKDRGERVSKTATDELRAMVSAMDLGTLDRHEVQHIAVDLLPILPEAAFSLLEKGVGPDRDKSVIEAAIQAIEDSLQTSALERDFGSGKLRVDLEYISELLSSWLNNLPYPALQREVASLSSTAVKEYIVRQWCRQNAEADQVADAVIWWLDIVISDRYFAVLLRSLRHMSEVVGQLPETKRETLVKRLQVPEFAALSAPAEEWTRFHLNLATALAKPDCDTAAAEVHRVQDRILTEPMDLDIKAYCLSRLWATIQHIFPQHTGWVSDVQIKFTEAFNLLLEDSADHLKPIAKTLRSLVDIDPMTSLMVALELNTHKSRSRAIRLILRETLRKQGATRLGDFVHQALTFLEPQDVAGVLVDIASEINARDLPLHRTNLEELLKHTTELTDPAIAARVLTNLAGIMHGSQHGSAKDTLEDAFGFWRCEPDLRLRLSLGFSMVQSIAKIDMDVANRFCEEVRELEYQPGAALASGELGVVFRQILGLAMRSLGKEDLSRINDDLDPFGRLISKLPSPTARIGLFARLAAGAYRFGYSGLGDRVVRTQVLPSAEMLQSKVDLAGTLVEILPVIFEYDPECAENLTLDLPQTLRDTAWYSVVLWSLCRSSLGDSKCEPKEIRITSDYPRLKKTLKAVREISYDTLLCNAIIATAQSVSKSFPSELDVTQGLDILESLEQIALAKLPEGNRNIKHEGYRVLAEASVNRARFHLYLGSRQKHKFSRKEISTKWRDLTDRGQAIPNLADRVYVTALLADEMTEYHKRDKSPIRAILQRAEAEVRSIPTVIDRIDRLEAIAESWSHIGGQDKTQFLMIKGAQLATQLSGASADSRLGLLIQSAYELDPGLAIELASRLDTRLQTPLIRPTDIGLLTSRLRSDPSKLHTLPDMDGARSYVIKKACQRLVRDLATGRGTDYTDAIVEDWLIESCSHEPSVAFGVATWAIETLRRRGDHVASLPSPQELVDIAEMCLGLAGWLANTYGAGIPEIVHDGFAGLSTRYVSFHPNEADSAREWLVSWLRDNTKDYLKICDPYFGPNELEIFVDVPIDTKILVVTSDKGLRVSQGVPSLRQELLSQWKERTPRIIPDVLFYVLTQDLEERFHDRAVITRDAGLDLGPSVNGLGLSYQKIAILPKADAADLESSYVNNMLNTASLFLGGEHPITFSLRY